MAITRIPRNIVPERMDWYENLRDPDLVYRQYSQHPLSRVYPPRVPGQGGFQADPQGPGINSPFGRLLSRGRLSENISYALNPTPGRSPNLARVDPRLINIVRGGADGLPPGYKVTVNEGYNAAGHVPKSQHHVAGSGALDVQIWDPQGNPIPNKGRDTTGMYGTLARNSYGYMLQTYPELKGKFASGIAFGTGRGSKTPDLMHFDLGGERGRLGPQPWAKMSPAELAYTGGPPRAPAQHAAADLAAGQPPGGPVLRKGATDAGTGGAVTRLQQQLAAMSGGPPVAVNGKYGKQTEAAVRQVESQYGLTRDRGVAGPQVQAALAGNERMQIVADTQRRFGGPLAPGGFPLVGYPNAGQIPAVPGAPPSIPPAQASALEAAMAPNAPYGVQRGGISSGGGGVPAAPFNVGAGIMPGAGAIPSGFSGDLPAPGVPPAPLVAQQEGGAPGGPAPVASVPARGYDTRGVSAGLSSPNVGAANALMQQVAARQAAAPPVSRFGTTDYFPENVSSADYTTGVPGRTGNAPTGINNFGDIANAWQRIGSDVAGAGRDVAGAGRNFSDWAQRQLSGGPPTSTATPSPTPGQGIPPAVPASASPYGGYVPGGYDAGRQNYGVPQRPPQQSSLGGDQQVAAYAGPPGTNDNPGGGPGPGPYPQYAGRGSADVLRGSSGADVVPSGGPFQVGAGWGNPSQVIRLGDSPNDGPQLVNPGGPIDRSGGEFPASGLHRWSNPGGPVVSSQSDIPGLAYIDTPQEQPGGFGAFGPVGDQTIAPAGFSKAIAPADNGLGQQPTSELVKGPLGAVRPRSQLPLSAGQRIGVGALSVVPALGPLLSLIGKSAMHGSFDRTTPYTGGSVTNYERAPASMSAPWGGGPTTPWGSRQYTTGGPNASLSASAFTPSAPGWHAPSFNPVSGGALYAYNPETHTYVDSQGRTHSYD